MAAAGYGPRSEVFADAFAAAFGLDDLEMFTADHLGVKIQHIVDQGTIDLRVRRVMDYASRRGWELKLVDAVAAARPDSETVENAARWVRAHLGSVASANWYESPDPVETCFIRTDWPLFDRSGLRNGLRSLSVGRTPRTLVVRGGSGSGRSYAGLVATHVAEQAEHSVCPLDLVSLPPGFSADALVRLIALRVGLASALDHMPRRARRTPPRYNLELASWLVAEIEAVGTTWWVLLDHFDKVAVPPATMDFVAQLMRAAETSARNLRIVLLGAQDLLPDDLEQMAHSETIQEIGRANIKEFFWRFADHMSIPATEATIDQNVDRVLAAAPAGPDRLRKLNEAARQVARAFAEPPPPPPEED